MQENNKNEKDLLSIGLLFFFCRKKEPKNYHFFCKKVGKKQLRLKFESWLIKTMNIIFIKNKRALEEEI